jgi:hypothetical protein
MYVTALAFHGQSGAVALPARGDPESPTRLREGIEPEHRFEPTSQMAIQHKYTLLPPMLLEQRIRSLEREDDWDGQDADAITADTCEAALQFVRQLLRSKPGLPLPFPAPSAYGAVSLRWVNGDKDLAIYVFSPDRVETYLQQPDGRYALVPVQPAEATELLVEAKSYATPLSRRARLLSREETLGGPPR